MSDPIERFCDVIRFPTVSAEGPAGSYQACFDYLEAWCKRLGLETSACSPVEKKPILIATWKGSDPSLKTLLLNAHYDVVPAEPEKWDVDPFSGHVTEDGWIYGRGTQDMKCVVCQYLEAVERLQADGFVPKRTIHLTFVPDEELGGVDGVSKFVLMDEFKALNVGCALDEGLANETDAMTVFYGERAVVWLRLKATGPVGHGSRFVPNTAMVKLINVVQKFLNFREEQEALLGGEHAGCKHSMAKKLGDVTTLNLTMLQGGVSKDGGETYMLNVIPGEAYAGFDIRIPPSVDLDDFEKQIGEWTSSEEGVAYEFIFRAKQHAVSETDREKSPWWACFSDACDAAGITVEAEVFPAATDSRYIRALGIPAFGFSPISNTPILLHDHNERLHKDVYLRGIDIFTKIIPSLANFAGIE